MGNGRGGASFSLQLSAGRKLLPSAYIILLGAQWTCLKARSQIDIKYCLLDTSENWWASFKWKDVMLSLKFNCNRNIAPHLFELEFIPFGQFLSP